MTGQVSIFPATQAQLARFLCRNQVVSGVYLLYSGDQIVYIGQSKDVMARIPAHRDKDWDSAFVIQVGRYLLDDVEGALIERFRPLYNARSSNGHMYTPKKVTNEARQMVSRLALAREKLEPLL